MPLVSCGKNPFHSSACGGVEQPITHVAISICVETLKNAHTGHLSDHPLCETRIR